MIPSYCRPFLEMSNRPKYSVDLQKITYINTFMYHLDSEVDLLHKAIEENDIIRVHNVLYSIKNRCEKLLEKEVKPMLEKEIKKQNKTTKRCKP